MSADIVERLRQYEGEMSQTTMCYNGTREEAASEITSLRTRLAEAERENESLSKNGGFALWKERALAAERDRDRYASDAGQRAGKLDAAEAEIARLTKENDALYAKVQSLALHGTCGCSYDSPDDVCMHHSPKLAAAESALAKAQQERDERDEQLTAEFSISSKLAAENRRLSSELARAREALRQIAEESMFSSKDRIVEHARAALSAKTEGE